ncbi:hypothetical protein MUP77_14785 [Candidatus Bathyarchaeota archaeon]|nr:hypothetical protein [Candidatus Bathyarchaeota archaeon]
MSEKDEELQFMVNLYKRAQNRGYYGTFSNFLDEIFYPIKNYPEGYVDPFHEILETFKLGIEVARKDQIKKLEPKIESSVEYVRRLKEIYEFFEPRHGKSDIDWKLEELRVTERIETRKLDLEEKKWEYNKQRDADIRKSREERGKAYEAYKAERDKAAHLVCQKEEEDALDKWLKANMQRIRDELLVALIEAEKEKLRLAREAPEKEDKTETGK